MITRAVVVLFVLLAAWCCGHSASRAPFNETLARRLTYYAATAYAPPDDILSLNFENKELKGNLSATFAPLETFHSRTYISDAFAYLGIDHAQKELFMIFKGTNSSEDILHDIINSLDSVLHYADPCMLNEDLQLNIHKGFCWYYQSLLSAGIVETFLQVNAQFPDFRIIVTGHSLGGALASIFAVHVASTVSLELTLYTYGAPRVGDTGFAKAFDTLAIDAWRVVHWKDVIVHMSPCCSGMWGANLCSADRSGCPYHHGGEAWYPEDMANSPPTAICSGGENETACSGSSGIDLYEGVKYHLYYYGVCVGDFSQSPDGAAERQARMLANFHAAYPPGGHLPPAIAAQARKRDTATRTTTTTITTTTKKRNGSTIS